MFFFWSRGEGVTSLTKRVDDGIPLHQKKSHTKMPLTGKVLRAVTDAIDDDDAFAMALVCGEFHDAVRRRYPAGTRTWPHAMVTSLTRVKWARRNGCPFTLEMGSCAAGRGNVDVLEWMYPIYECPLDGNEMAVRASQGGHGHVLKFLEKKALVREDPDVFLYGIGGSGKSTVIPKLALYPTSHHRTVDVRGDGALLARQPDVS